MRTKNRVDKFFITKNTIILIYQNNPSLLIAVIVSGCGGSGSDNISEKLKITAINPIDDYNIINVEWGTNKSTALPDSITVSLFKNTTSLPVDWNNGEPIYDKNTSGTYTFTGTLDIAGINYTNPNNLMDI